MNKLFKPRTQKEKERDDEVDAQMSTVLSRASKPTSMSMAYTRIPSHVHAKFHAKLILNKSSIQKFLKGKIMEYLENDPN